MEEMHPHHPGHETGSFPGWPQKLPELSCVGEGRHGQTPGAGSTHLELQAGRIPLELCQESDLAALGLLSLWRLGRFVGGVGAWQHAVG